MGAALSAVPVQVNPSSRLTCFMMEAIITAVTTAKDEVTSLMLE
jgi:hypothetical protein